MQKYANSVQDTFGNALSLATVTVYTDSAHTTLATIYSDDGVTPTANPFSTDSLGEFSFYAADGRYYIKVSKSGITTQYLDDVLIFDPNASTGAAYVKYLPSGSGAYADTVAGWLERQGWVLITNFMTAAERTSLAAGSTVDVTTALTNAAATGKPIWGPYGAYQISSPVTVSSDMHFQGLDTNQSIITLTSTGQLIVGDQGIHWRGFKVTSAVNNLTLVKVADTCNYFRFDNFQIVGTGTGQVGVEMAATTTGLAFCTFEKFLVQCATCFKTSGAGYCNGNKFGDKGDSWQNGTQFLDVQNTGGFQSNGIAGYCENASATSFLKIAASCTVSFNVFNVWLDKPGGTMNSVDNAGTLGVNEWQGLTPDLWLQTGAGTFSAQTFSHKITAGMHLASDQTGVGDAAFVKLAFDTETYDPWAVLSSATYTSPREAKVHVSAQMQMTTNLADQDSVFISIYKNGSEHSRCQVVTSGAGGAYASISRTISLAKADYLEIFVRGDQTAANNNHIVTGSSLITFATFEEV